MPSLPAPEDAHIQQQHVRAAFRGSACIVKSIPRKLDLRNSIAIHLGIVKRSRRNATLLSFQAKKKSDRVEYSIAKDGFWKRQQKVSLTSEQSHELDSSEEREEKSPWDSSGPNHFRGRFLGSSFGRERDS